MHRLSFALSRGTNGMISALTTTPPIPRSRPDPSGKRYQGSRHAGLFVIVRCFAMCQRGAERQRFGKLVRTATPRDASGGNALTGRVNAPVNTDRRPIQKARNRFPGAGSILAMMNICR